MSEEILFRTKECPKIKMRNEDVLLARVNQQKRYKPYTQKLAVIRQDLKPHKTFRIHGRIYVKNGQTKQ